MRAIKRKIQKKNKALMGIMVVSMGLFTFAPGAAFADSVYVAGSSSSSAASSASSQSSSNSSLSSSVSNAKSKNSELQQKVSKSSSNSNGKSEQKGSSSQNSEAQSSKLQAAATPSPYSSMANNYGAGVSTSVNPQTGQLSFGINVLALMGNTNETGVDISLTNSGSNNTSNVLLQNGAWTLSLPYINTTSSQLFLGGGENYYYDTSSPQAVSIDLNKISYTANEYLLKGYKGYDNVLLSLPSTNLASVPIYQGIAVTKDTPINYLTVGNIQFIMLSQDGSAEYFNTQGELVAAAGPSGNGIVYGYNSAGQLNSIMDAFGDEITISYTDTTAQFYLPNGVSSKIDLTNSNDVIITDINDHQTSIITTETYNTPSSVAVTYPSGASQTFTYSVNPVDEIAYSAASTSYWPVIVQEIDNPNNNSNALKITNPPTGNSSLTTLNEDETVVNYAYNYKLTPKTQNGITTFTASQNTSTAPSNNYTGYNLISGNYDPTDGDPLMMESNNDASSVNAYYYATSTEICSLPYGSKSTTAAIPISKTITVYDGYQLPIESMTFDETNATTPTLISESGTLYVGQNNANSSFANFNSLSPNYNLPYISWSTSYNGTATKTIETENTYNSFNQPLTENEYAITPSTSSTSSTPTTKLSSDTPIAITAYTYSSDTGILGGILPSNSGLPSSSAISTLEADGKTYQKIQEVYTPAAYANNPLINSYYQSNSTKSYADSTSTASADRTDVAATTQSYTTTIKNDVFGKPSNMSSSFTTTSTEKGLISSTSNGNSTSTSYTQIGLNNGDVGITESTSYYANASSTGTPVYTTSKTVDEYNGNVASSTDQMGGTTTYTYSNNNNTITVTSPDGESVIETITKDGSKNNIQYTYSTGEVVTDYLDGFGNTVEQTVTYPGEPTITSYQINNPSTTYVVSNEGALEVTNRDAQGRTIQTVSYLPNNTNPSQIINYTYNDAVNDTNSPTTAYSVTESLTDGITSPANTYPISTTDYDSNGHVVGSVTQNGETSTSNVMNALGQVESSTLFATPSTSGATPITISGSAYIYNADGSTASSTTLFPTSSPEGGVILGTQTNYTYNIPGSPSYTSTKVLGLSAAPSISADASVSNATLTSDNYTYDGLGELLSIKDHLGNTESYQYNYNYTAATDTTPAIDNGLVVIETTFQGSTITSTYNSYGQLTEMDVTGGAAGETADYTYVYNPGTDTSMDAGQLASVTLTDTINKSTYTDEVSYTYGNYGMVSQVTETDHSGAKDVTTQKMSYTYGPLSTSDSTPVLQNSTDFAGRTTSYTYYGNNQETVAGTQYYVLPTDIEKAQSSNAYINYQYLSYQAGGSGVFAYDAFIYFGGSDTPYQTTEGTVDNTVTPPTQSPVLITLTNYSSLEGVAGKTMQIASVNTYKDTPASPATVTVGTSPDAITATGTLIDGTAYTYYTADSVNSGTGSAYEIGNIYQEEETTGLSPSDYSNCAVQPTALDINNIRQYQYNQFGNLIEEDVYAVGTVMTDGVPLMNTAVTPVQTTDYTYNTNDDMVTQNIYLNGSAVASGTEAYTYNNGSDPTGTVTGNYVTDQVASIAVTGTLPGIPPETTNVVVTRDATGYNVAEIDFNQVTAATPAVTTTIEAQTYAYNNQNQLTSFMQYAGAATGTPVVNYTYGYNALGLRAYKTDNLANS